MELGEYKETIIIINSNFFKGYLQYTKEYRNYFPLYQDRPEFNTLIDLSEHIGEAINITDYCKQTFKIKIIDIEDKYEKYCKKLQNTLRIHRKLHRAWNRIERTKWAEERYHKRSSPLSRRVERILERIIKSYNKEIHESASEVN